MEGARLDQETSAILHHRRRNSGREVRIRLGASGIEIMSLVGENIATWPYDALAFVKTDDPAPHPALRLPHDDLLQLRVASADWLSAITTRSRGLSRYRREARWAFWESIWAAIPEQPKSGIVLGGLVLAVWGIYTAHEWLADLF